jgi:hypothetical protein
MDRLVRRAMLAALMAPALAAPAAADCGDWMRQVALPKMGCSPEQVTAICAGQMPVPTTPYCGGQNRPAAGQGDWCQTPVGGCQLPQLAPLDSDCRCASAAGMVPGWVKTQ